MALLHDWEKVRHQVAILGHVTNAQTGEAMEGIVVTITAGPPDFMERVSILRELHGEETWKKMKDRPDKTRTARDGRYYFMDLPVGDYSVVASFPHSTRRFSDDEGVATVASGDHGSVWDRLDLQLSVSTLKGRVTSAEDDDDDEAIHMAEVRVVGSGERAFSDSDGNYSLVGIEYGERRVEVEATGYHGQSTVVTLAAAGEVETKDFSLTPKSPAD